MKTVVAGLATLLLVSGCVAVPYYDAYPRQYMPPQQVVVTPPVRCIPPYYPVWNGCALPMYWPPQYYGGMYTYPLFEPGLWFNFNFGHRGHHRGGGHHRGR